MRKRRLLWQIYPSYLLITFVALLAVAWYASRALKTFYLRETTENLASEARVVTEHFEPDLIAESNSEIDTICKRIGKEAKRRITVIDPSGIVLGDSDENPERMDNHADRPEIRAALSGKTGVSTRYSYTLEKKMMYVAVPLYDAAHLTAVVRVAIPITAMNTVLKSVYIKIASVGVIIALLASGVSLWISHRISRPLVELKRGAERFAKGDLGRRLPVPRTEEIGALATSMNQMASELDARIQMIVRQKNQEEAILSSMIESVLAVDLDERIIMMNQAAARLFHADAAKVEGRSLQEIVRNPALHQFVAAALSGHPPTEGTIALPDGKRVLHARGTVLSDQKEERIGALIVLHDMTQVRRLEQIRRDFVANVSHELRTPITSIQGFVETLLQGAMENRDEAKRFLNVIAKHTNRLNAIIEDLLALSRIEQEAERSEIALEKGDICSVLEAAVDSCRVGASVRRVELNLTCSEPCPAKINAPLLEQAVVNLIDNAIKYSEPEGIVDIEGSYSDEEMAIHVRDHGCGIADEHLPRIFERFYRVDKARSRELGGTGLGLAIAKHIAIAHEGRISVESKLGEGSVFTIHLPGIEP